MSESADWKQKYRAAVLESEAAEHRWSQTEQALRRLIGRLCAAGMGVDPQLDDELVCLAAANRRQADTLELERLAASLTTAVIAVDAVSPVLHASTGAALGTWTSTCAAVGKILHYLQSQGLDEPITLELLAQLKRASSDAVLAVIVDKTAELIDRHGASLMRERLAAASLLFDVTQRLEEVAGYLAETGSDACSRFADSATVNETVMLQMRELSAQIDEADELGKLQAIVRARLQAVTQQVLAFRSREEQRMLEHTGRAERMRARISDLEREAEDLNSKLDHEKHGARLDPLTRLANRKSFDERFTQEALRRSAEDTPVSMLLWDLDNFKVINDTYGHRAGDRVLQTVASCFLSGLRAEDFVARIGGEEFVILLSGLPLAKALQIADELRTGVEALRLHFRGTPVRVTASCGVTDLRRGDAAGAAFDRADAALYQAKHSGKNACKWA